MPRVSVIIPTYNRADLVKDAINSLLTQTFQDFELIVVDDGSTDQTQEIIRALGDSRINYVYQNHQERAIAKNHGAQYQKVRIWFSWTVMIYCSRTCWQFRLLPLMLNLKSG
jgi:glycosyltransferase involved in cell wall biosynthesis